MELLKEKRDRSSFPKEAARARRTRSITTMQAAAPRAEVRTDQEEEGGCSLPFGKACKPPRPTFPNFPHMQTQRILTNQKVSLGMPVGKLLN